MKRFLIIPDRSDPDKSCELAEKYHLGYEYNDFFLPDILDDEDKTNEIIKSYTSGKLPGYCTMHGAFFDVTVFSPDKKIQQISDMRVEQSIAIAKRIGAKAVIFHTNHNPFLNSEAYMNQWIETNAEYWGKVLENHRDINIYLENMFDQSPNLLASLSNRLCHNQNYGVCFDYAHAILSQTPIENWVKSLHKYVRHIHINDNDLISDLHLAIGDGKIEWNKFYESYNTYMSDASVLIETSSLKNAEKSLCKLIADGFFKSDN